MSGIVPYLIAGGVIVALALLWFVSDAAKRSALRRKRAKVNLQAYERRSKSQESHQQDYDKALEKLSKDWVVIDIIHDLGDFGMGPAGGLADEISYEEAFDIVSRIRAAQGGDIAVVLHTPGGLILPTDMIALALRQHKGRKEAFVPYTAMSGGTLIALSTQNVNMGDTAAIGPIDPQIAGWPKGAYDYLRNSKSKDHISDLVLMCAYEMDELTKSELKKLDKLVDAAHDKTQISNQLISGGRPHGEMIMFEDAKALGLKVSEGVPADVYALVDARLRVLAKDREKLYRRLSGAGPE
jgi:ClpP class serine protease